MAAFDIFNPSKLPPLPTNPSTEDIEIFSEYGKDNVEKLGSHFQGVVAESSIECIEEWNSFRQFLKDNCSKMKQREIQALNDTAWEEIYPNMSSYSNTYS